jgi:hypothetical protein
MDEKCSTNGKYVNALHKIFVGKPEEKRPFWIPRRRWEDGS